MKLKSKDTDPIPCDHQHTLIRETLLQIARQRELLDHHAAAALFALIETGSAVRRHLLTVLAEQGLTETKFCALTILHRIDPETTTAADLAYHTGVSRSAVTDIIDQMEAQQWVVRERASDDRRTVRIGLSSAGRELVERAIQRFMGATASLLQDFPEMSASGIATFCEAMDERLQRRSSVPTVPEA